MKSSLSLQPEMSLHTMKGSSEGDSSYTSTKLRATAMKAIESIKRPMSAHEIEHWISQHDKRFWREVSTKCYDYVRIILSVTKEKLVQYKCKTQMRGIDRRAVFYGLSNVNYDPNIWMRVGGHHTTEATILPLPPELTHSEMALEHDNMGYVPPKPQFQAVFNPNIDDILVKQSWEALTTRVLIDSSFWIEILQAISDMHEFIGQGYSASDSMHNLFARYTTLQDNCVFNDVINILSGEAKRLVG